MKWKRLLNFKKYETVQDKDKKEIVNYNKPMRNLKVKKIKEQR